MEPPLGILHLLVVEFRELSSCQKQTWIVLKTRVLFWGPVLTVPYYPDYGVHSCLVDHSHVIGSWPYKWYTQTRTAMETTGNPKGPCIHTSIL